MSRAHEWPSREQWAIQYQCPRYDDNSSCPYEDHFSGRLSSYASAAEIAALTTGLKDLYRELGRELKAVRQRIKPGVERQRGKPRYLWYLRFRELPTEDQAPHTEAHLLRLRRSAINDLLARVRGDQIPKPYSGCTPEEAGDLVAPFYARYDAAHTAAHDAYYQVYAAAHPPDDAAWEQELNHRAAVERYFAANETRSGARRATINAEKMEDHNA